MNDIDKPWLCEGDTLDFVDKKSGYQIALRRHPVMLHLCGYVGIPPRHPWHGKVYQDVEENIYVHGGLTYSGSHVRGSEDPDLWWFGFDCAHMGDLVPMVDYRLGGEVYRTIEYVENAAIVLAKQLAAVAPKRESIMDIIRSFG